MVNLQKKTAELLLKSSQRIAQVIPSASFEFWERKDFRLLVDFNRLSHTEQDRMFNELEVSLIGLFDLHLTYIASIAQPEFKKVFTLLQKELITSFISVMSQHGVELKHINIWQALIDIRLKEYWKDYRVVLKEASSWEEFAGNDAMRLHWARIETITIGCLQHIQQGNVNKNDKLWKLLRLWFITLDTNLSSLEKLA